MSESIKSEDTPEKQMCIEDELFLELVIECIFLTIVSILSRSELDSDLALDYMCKK